MTDYVEKAREALKQPDSYFGTDLDDTGEWGRIGISYCRDSKPGERAVAEAIAGELLDRFGNDFQWQGASHWAVGWVDELLCRVLKSDGIYPPVSEDELTDAFKFAVDMAEDFDLSDYENVILEAEYEETLENIGREWPACLKYPDDIDREEAHRRIYVWLHDNDFYGGGDDGTWFSPEEIALAGFHLNMWDMDWDEDGWYEMVEKEGIVNTLKQYTIALHNTPMFP